MTYGVCGNPDCSAILDAPGAEHLDLWTGELRTLCPVCTNQAAAGSDARYERQDPIPKEEDDGIEQ